MENPDYYSEMEQVPGKPGFNASDETCVQAQ
jgi:hypothetical protein